MAVRVSTVKVIRVSLIILFFSLLIPQFSFSFFPFSLPSVNVNVSGSGGVGSRSGSGSSFHVAQVQAQAFQQSEIPLGELMVEGVPIVQRKEDLIVTWVLKQQAPYVINVTIQNLLSTNRQINLTMILDNLSFPVDGLQVEGFYEWKNISYTVNIPDYAPRTFNATITNVLKIDQLTNLNLSQPVDHLMGNPNGPNYAAVSTVNGTLIVGYDSYEWVSPSEVRFYWTDMAVVGYHSETRYKLDWKPCKMQMVKKTAVDFKANMELITLPKYGSKPSSDGTVNGTKQFRLTFKSPMNWNIRGRVALNIDGSTFDPWYNSNWQYRKSHVIQGSTAGAQTNYQMKIIVHYGSGTDSGGDVYLNGKCRTDFGDVRFTSSDGTTLIDYWMESYTASSQAVFWVEVPSIPASPDTATIYIYYGNSGAGTTSNGADTFLAFDHFDGTSLDASKWDTSGVASVSVSGSVVSFTSAAAGPRTLVYKVSSFSNLAVYARMKSTGTNPTVGVIMRKASSAGSTDDSYYSTYFSSAAVNSNYNWIVKRSGGTDTWITGSTDVLTADTWYRLCLYAYGSSLKYDLWSDSFSLIRSLTATDTALTSGYAGLSVRWNDKTMYCDFFFIRKYVSPEPSHGSWGSEESGSWFPSAWQYRKSHVIQGSTAGAQTNYQMKIIVHYGSGTDSGGDVYLNGHCRTDFGDVRFTSSDGTTLIDYWMETYTASDKAIFWVEVPSIPASPDTATIYIYYGNSGATTTSNGADTFLLFDDASADNTASWSKYNVNTFSWLSPGNGYRVYLNNARGYIYRSLSHDNVRMYADIYLVSKDPELMARGGNIGGSVSIYVFGNDPPSGRRIDKAVSGSWTQIASGSSSTLYTANAWNWAEVTLYGGSLAFTANNGGTISVSDSSISSGSQIGFGGYGDSSNPTEFYIKNIRVGKYVSPEPSHGSWGSEEVPNQAPVNGGLSLTNPSIGSQGCLAAKQAYTFRVTVSDADGGSNLNYVQIYLDPSGVNLQYKWDEATDSFTEVSDPNNYASISSTSADSTLSGTQWTLDFKITFAWTYPDENLHSVRVYSVDDAGATDDDTYSNIYYVENDLVFSGLSVSDTSVYPGQTLTFSGTIYYQGTSTTPPDGNYNVVLKLSGVQKGTDTTLVNGGFSIGGVAAESSPGSYQYTVECNYMAAAGSFPTVTVNANLTFSNLAVSSYEVYPGETLVFTGTLHYQEDPSVAPPDGNYNVKVKLNGVQKGSTDTTLVNGQFSIGDVTAEPPGKYNYTVECDSMASPGTFPTVTVKDLVKPVNGSVTVSTSTSGSTIQVGFNATYYNGTAVSSGSFHAWRGSTCIGGGSPASPGRIEVSLNVSLHGSGYILINGSDPYGVELHPLLNLSYSCAASTLTVNPPSTMTVGEPSSIPVSFLNQAVLNGSRIPLADLRLSLELYEGSTRLCQENTTLFTVTGDGYSGTVTFTPRGVEKTDNYILKVSLFQIGSEYLLAETSQQVQIQVSPAGPLGGGGGGLSGLEGLEGFSLMLYPPDMVKATPGSTVSFQVRLKWSGSNQFTIADVSFSGPAASWAEYVGGETKGSWLSLWGSEPQVTVKLTVPSGVQPGSYSLIVSVTGKGDMGATVTSHAQVPVEVSTAVSASPYSNWILAGILGIFTIIFLATMLPGKSRTTGQPQPKSKSKHEGFNATTKAKSASAGSRLRPGRFLRRRFGKLKPRKHS